MPPGKLHRKIAQKWNIIEQTARLPGNKIYL